MSLVKKAAAELIGTFWLVFGGCGAACLACGANNFGIGYVGVSLAFGLTVLTMAYAIGHISGCHLNPAVTLGLLASGRFKGGKETVAYIIAQCLGGILAAGILFSIVNPASTMEVGAFASNGWSDSLVNGYNAFGGKIVGASAAFLVEAVLTCVFLLVIIGSTDKRAPKGFAPIAIGLCLTLIHLISIPVTNTSVNPARSLATAFFAGIGSPAMSQLWLFWVAPIVGAVVAGIIYKFVFEEKSDDDDAADGDEPKKCCGKCKCAEKAEDAE